MSSRNYCGGLITVGAITVGANSFDCWHLCLNRVPGYRRVTIVGLSGY
jgi:hypothetical protein